ncbi:MAG: hypothetical protein Q4B04_01950 [bacterium]|nr:hypothetical protein [bacterium]
MFVDTHSHVLPGLDDGARNLEESLKLLRILKKQNVDVVVATPHFYDGNEAFEDYLARRQSAYDAVKECLTDDMPELYLGCEVKYFRGISNIPEIRKLRIGNSDYILLELPYRSLTPSEIYEISDLKYSLGLTPILAHVERYIRFSGFSRILELLKEGEVLAQINAEKLDKIKKRRRVNKLVKLGVISLLGSDTHSIKYRPPTVNMFFEGLDRKIRASFVKDIEYNSKIIYDEIK